MVYSECTAIGSGGMIMQEEANQKTVGLVVTATKFTGRTFARAVEKYLQHRRNVKHEHKMEKKQDPSTYEINQPKRVKMKTLVKEGAQVSSIELKDDNIRAFEKVAKKHGIRYAIKKDKSTDPPTYMIFFKGKDAEVINHALREFTKKQLKRKDKTPVISERLKKYKAMAKENASKLAKDRHKEQVR